jgi:hypothetical protein
MLKNPLPQFRLLAGGFVRLEGRTLRQKFDSFLHLPVEDMRGGDSYS